MLSHDEQRRLADLEAQLHAEDPRLAAVLAGVHPATQPALGASAPSTTTRVLRTVAVVAAVLALTAAATLAVGPDLGGFVGAVGLPLAGLYGWRQLGSCPSRRT